MADVVCLSSGDEMELDDIVEVYEEVSKCKSSKESSLLVLMISEWKLNIFDLRFSLI